MSRAADVMDKKKRRLLKEGAERRKRNRRREKSNESQTLNGELSQYQHYSCHI